ncbi:MAG: cytochrome-c peroxidase [Haliscomenobacter sp.]
MKVRLTTFSLAMTSLLLWTCQPEEVPACTDCPTDDTIAGAYNPTPYPLKVPAYFPPPIVLPDNPLTVEGVELGRRLFYDPILSADSTQSCSSCHEQAYSFASPQRVNKGILGLEGSRNAMALINLAYHPRGFFWDGRADSPENLALKPVEDHLEMNDTWENVEKKLRRHGHYPLLFRKAFGIATKSEIKRGLAVQALGQFMRTLISGQSRYDYVFWERKGFPTDSEQRGLELFFIEDNQDLDHPGCSHCHFNPFFTDHNFRNNGLNAAATLADFPDKGRGAISQNPFDNGKFKVPTLRNIALTAPYMHDGRFASLEEVLDHYSSGGHPSPNADPNIRRFPLSAQDKKDLIAFLNMLTDTAFVRNPAFASPF